MKNADKSRSALPDDIHASRAQAAVAVRTPLQQATAFEVADSNLLAARARRPPLPVAIESIQTRRGRGRGEINPHGTARITLHRIAIERLQGGTCGEQKNGAGRSPRGDADWFHRHKRRVRRAAGPWGLVLRNTTSLAGPAGPSGPLPFPLHGCGRLSQPSLPTQKSWAIPPHNEMALCKRGHVCECKWTARPCTKSVGHHHGIDHVDCAVGCLNVGNERRGSAGRK